MTIVSGILAAVDSPGSPSEIGGGTVASGEHLKHLKHLKLKLKLKQQKLKHLNVRHLKLKHVKLADRPATAAGPRTTRHGDPHTSLWTRRSSSPRELDGLVPGGLDGLVPPWTGRSSSPPCTHAVDEHLTAAEHEVVARVVAELVRVRSRAVGREERVRRHA